MVKHFILSINPTAKHEWDRCILRDVLSSKRPDIGKLIAEAVGADEGNYWKCVNFVVEFLQKKKAPVSGSLKFSFPETSQKPQLREAV